MKKFVFPFAALLSKNQQEEKRELYELAKIVVKLNALHETKQTLLKNMEKWRNAFKGQAKLSLPPSSSLSVENFTQNPPPVSHLSQTSSPKTSSLKSSPPQGFPSNSPLSSSESDHEPRIAEPTKQRIEELTEHPVRLSKHPVRLSNQPMRLSEQPVRLSYGRLQNAMRAHLQKIGEEEQALNEVIRAQQEKVLRKRQAVKKIEILKNSHVAVWKKRKQRHETAELQEKVLRHYMTAPEHFRTHENLLKT